MPLSVTARRAMFARESTEVFVGLLRITHPTLSQPLRFANSREDFPSRGNIYDGTSFDARLPPQVDGAEPIVEIVVQNVDRLVDAALAVLVSEPIFVYEMVLASEPDTVVVGPYRLPLRSSETRMGTLTLTLGGSDPMLSRAFPRIRYSQADFPGLAIV